MSPFAAALMMSPAPAQSRLGQVAPTIEGGKVDAKLAFLARAAVRFELVKAGELDIDEAFAGLIADLRCNCGWEATERWERNYPHRPKKAARKRFRSAAQSTYDALLYELRTRGIASFRKEACLNRLEALSEDQVRDLIGALSRLKSANAVITDDLLASLGECL